MLKKNQVIRHTKKKKEARCKIQMQHACSKKLFDFFKKNKTFLILNMYYSRSCQAQLAY